MMDTKKAPREAATSKSAENNVQEQYNTTSQERQEAFRLATALESLATDIEQAQQLVGLLAENLDEEGQKEMRPERIKIYTASLWVLFDHLRTLRGVAESDAAHYYLK